ncbi:MAG: hypothetical protein ACE366_27320 [Bradymonadia bacterium]
MRRSTLVHALLLIGAFVCATALSAHAEPLADAKTLATEGEKTLKKASRIKKRSKRAGKLAEGLKKISEAYVLITTHELQNDAPELLQKINDHLARTNALTEISELRQQLMAKAIDATVAGKMNEAYETLARLKELDPRDPNVDYALTVVSERMEDQ